MASEVLVSELKQQKFVVSFERSYSASATTKEIQKILEDVKAVARGE